MQHTETGLTLLATDLPAPSSLFEGHNSLPKQPALVDEYAEISLKFATPSALTAGATTYLLLTFTTPF